MLLGTETGLFLPWFSAVAQAIIRETIMERIESIDKRLSKDWGIAHVSGMAFMATIQYYRLANRITGRAHDLGFYGLGASLGFDAPSIKTRDNRGHLRYKSFTTSKAVNFEDFNLRGATLTSIKTPLYSRSYLSINQGLNPLGSKLARIQWSGWSLPTKLKLSGQPWVNGVMKLSLGNGDLDGTIDWVMDPEKFPEDFGPQGPRMAHVRSTPQESPIIQLPGDIFFAFGSATLSAAARPMMMDVLHTIETKNAGRVVIEGHTDSKGSDAFNQGLSMQRAETIKRWLVTNGCERAASFATRGRGETDPVAPNNYPDGRDNPEGRAQNRRVEIKFQ